MKSVYLVALFAFIAFGCVETNTASVYKDVYSVETSGCSLPDAVNDMDTAARAVCGEKPYAIRNVRSRVGCTPQVTAWVYCGEAMYTDR